MPRPTRPCRSRPSSRTPTSAPSSRRRPPWRSSLPTEGIVPASDPKSVAHATRLDLFRLVLLQRLVEERVLALYRQGRIAGSVYDGRGPEAVAAGAGLALGPADGGAAPHPRLA